ncbi:MAG: hypothetical protein WC306_03995, partial [Candidatus Paceibacterota bacterium]
FSGYSDFSGVVTVPQSELESYPLGANVTMRAGTKLVKITTDPKVYAVEPSGVLKWVPDEATAIALYGNDWAKRVVDVPDAFFTNYTVSTAQVSSSAFPAGSLVKFGTDADVYYINADGTASKVTTEAAFTANRFKWSDVITSTLAMPTAGADISTGTMTDTSQGGGGKGIVAGSGTGLTVALASDTPASGTTLSETTNGGDGAQALIPVAKVNFTAAADGAVKVTTLKFKRAGVPSADTDFAELYLYDGANMLAKYTSISEGVLTFTNSAGLFTVAAGATKTITLKVNLVDEAAASRAYNFAVLSASDVTTDGAVVSGSFPMTGNTMSTATVTDLGKFTVAETGTISNPDPGATNQEIFKFTAAAADQNIDVEKLKFTIIGTVSAGDMTNFKLDVGGTQLGSTVAAMASDKTITFDFPAPYRIDKGITKTISLKADIVSGTSRTFRVYFYNKEDIVVKDMGYNVYVTPNQADTWTKIYYSNATEPTINTGSLTISKNTTSPSGNVAKGATGVEVGKFDLKAVGEAIKIDSIWVYQDDSVSNGGLYQVKLYVDGSQVGTTQNLTEVTAKEFTCGNSLIIPANTTKTVIVKADIKGVAGGALTDNETITLQLRDTTNLKSVDYTRQVTGTTGTGGVVNANVLTVKTGTLTFAENGSFSDRSVTSPTGVVNATEAKIASFALTAGAGESVTVSQISLIDYNVLTLMGNNFQNLKLKNGTTQLGTTIGNLSTSAVGSYNFSPSPSIKIAAGQQYIVDVYADIKGSATQTAMNMYGIKFASASATGDTTNATADVDPDDTELQTIYIAAQGNLNISDSSDKPLAQQLVMGATDQTVAKFKLEASTSEDLNISQLTISDMVSAAATGTLTNIKITDGTTTWGPVVLDTTNATTTYAHAVFTGMNLTIPAGGFKTLTVKADVSAVANAVSGSTHKLAILADDGITGETVVVKGAQSGIVLTRALDTIDYYAASGDSAIDLDQTGNIMTVYRTKITVAWHADMAGLIGASIGNTAQTIAKINITNANSTKTATIKYLNLALSTTISNTADRALNIYKDDTTTTPLETTSWLAAGVQNFDDTKVDDNGMTDVDIAPGETKVFIFTLDTTDANAVASVTKLLS